MTGLILLLAALVLADAGMCVLFGRWARKRYSPQAVCDREQAKALRRKEKEHAGEGVS